MISAYGRMTTKPVIIIRAGHDTKEFGDDYDSQTVGTMEDDEFVTFEGNAKESVLGETYVITNERLRAAIRVANQMTGRPVRLLRRGDDDPHWLQQTHGVDGKGKIIMARNDIPELRATKVHTGRDGNNQIDKAAFIATTKQMLANYEAGLVDVVRLETSEIAVAGEKRRARCLFEVELP